MDDATRAHPLRQLVFEYLERAEDEEPSAVLEDLCAKHPDRAGALRARVRLLQGTGLSTRAADAPPPRRLGPFELRERIGGGGMGVVHRALDASLGREVALKLVRPGELLFPGARERFRREVEAVARLSHPGIVPVFSAGEEGEVPFFAMELVDGSTLAEVLARLALNGRAPEDLTGADLAAAIEGGGEDARGDGDAGAFFTGCWADVCARIAREVAEALEHAHRRGVLHRDVKPSNVMVTRDGRVMLLDFGLAAAEGGERITRTGSAPGSLPYMSPEQLEGGAPDRRTDVYALGVTLYELLALRLPFRDSSPSSLRASVIEARPEPVRRSNRDVSWELETIVATAMDPEPGRRYASAAALAGDLTAALEGRPIAARRAGPLRRARRWAARHPAGAALLGLTALVVLGGPLLFGWQERRARRAVEEKSVVIEDQRGELADANAGLQAAIAEAREQRDEARSQEERAERNFERAVAAVDTMLTRVAEEDLRDVPRLHELRAAVLEDALAFYLELLEEGGADRRLRHETARAWRRVGDLHGLLDRHADSEAALLRSAELFAELLAESPDDATLRVELAETRQLATLPQRQLGRHVAAEEQARLALAALDEAAGASDPETDLGARRAGLAVGLAQVLRESGRGGEARAELEAVLPELEAAHSAEPGELFRTHQLARAHMMLGVLAAEAAQPTPAAREENSRTSEGHHARALELLEPAAREHPDDARIRRDLGRTLINLGSAIVGRGEYAAAGDLLARGAEVSGALREDFPGVASYVADEATALLLLGAVRAALGRYEEGLSLVREAAAIFEEMAAAGSYDADAVRKLASAQLQEATLILQVGHDPDGALPVLERAIETHERAVALSPGMPQPAMGLEWCHAYRSTILLEAGDVEGAGESALAWAEVAQDPRRRAEAALRLARCAAAAEEAEELSSTERARLADRYDEAAAAALEQALDLGLGAREILTDPTFAPLLVRSTASAPLGARSDS